MANSKLNRPYIISQLSYAETEEDVLNLAIELRNMWPAGFMSDGATAWKSGKKDMATKLLRFHSEYGYEYTREQIIAAAQKYIDKYKFKPNHAGMRCSGHFIIKFPGTADQISDLATMLDQMEDDVSTTDSAETVQGLDWITNDCD